LWVPPFSWDSFVSHGVDIRGCLLFGFYSGRLIGAAVGLGSSLIGLAVFLVVVTFGCLDVYVAGSGLGLVVGWWP
jgi:hypothetical protein